MSFTRRALFLGTLAATTTACLHTRGVARPETGDEVRELNLPGDDGQTYSLREAVASHRAVVLVFYRGHW